MYHGWNLSGFVSRLKRASLPEMVYRTAQAINIMRMKFKSESSRCVADIPFPDDRAIRQLRIPPLVIEVSIDKIEAILDGKAFYLNEEAQALEQFDDFWRGVFFTEVRTSPEVSDIRTAWEPARLQNLATLFVYIDRNPGYSDIEGVKSYAAEQLLSWLRRNPFLKGPHYMSPMECGLRIPVFCYALMTLDNLAPRERREILAAVYLHAWWVSRNLSLYSSLGNHTICECVGLVFAAAVFRETPEGCGWLVRGVELLRRESVHQILPDGGPAEQSFCYHRFVLDLYRLATDFLETNGLCDCSDLRPRIDLGEAFLGCFQNAQGTVMPNIGDSDDGHAVAPGVVPMRNIRSGGCERMTSFTDAGYTVVKASDDCRLIFDHGPLGMAPLYNHGHADALSVVLYRNGLELLVDPGTYRYDGTPDFRSYFKGTGAHNTVTVDGCDQAVQETGFVWRHPYQAGIVRREITKYGVLIEAMHTGYKRLKSPVVHKRTMICSDGNIVIRDRFEGSGLHEYDLHFHVHPEAAVHRDGRWWRIRRSGAFIRISLCDDEFQYVYGSESPLLGWYSQGYGLKEKCGVLRCRWAGFPGDATFTTFISPDETPDLNGLKVLSERWR